MEERRVSYCYFKSVKIGTGECAKEFGTRSVGDPGTFGGVQGNRAGNIMP